MPHPWLSLSLPTPQGFPLSYRLERNWPLSSSSLYPLQQGLIQNPQVLLMKVLTVGIWTLTCSLGWAVHPYCWGLVFRHQIPFCHQERRFEEQHPKGWFGSLVWHVGPADPWMSPPSSVTPPQIIPQPEFPCLPHCSPSEFGIALGLLHKHSQERFLPRGSQANYTEMRGGWCRTQCQVPQGLPEQMSAQSHKASMEIRSIHSSRRKSALIVGIIWPSMPT